MDIKIIVNEHMPPNTMMIAPDLNKYFQAAINGDTNELKHCENELMCKVAILKNTMPKTD